VQLITALCFSALIAMAGSAAVDMSFDWGYQLVQKIAVQTTSSEQGWTAIYCLALAVMPLFFGIAFGWLYRAWLKSPKTALFSLVPFFGVVWAWACLVGGNQVLELVVCTSLFAALGLWSGHRVHAGLRRRVRVKPIIACGSLALLALFGASHVVQQDNPYSLFWELSIYACTLFSAGALSARFARAKDRMAAVLLALTTTAPIHLVNVLNLIGTLTCLLLHRFKICPDLGWQAVMSAVAINAVAVMATSAGGLFGYSRRSAVRLVASGSDPQIESASEIEKISANN